MWTRDLPKLSVGVLCHMSDGEERWELAVRSLLRSLQVGSASNIFAWKSITAETLITLYSHFLIIIIVDEDFYSELCERSVRNLLYLTLGKRIIDLIMNR